MGRQAQKIKTYQKIKREAAKAYNEETGDDSSWTRILSLLTSCSPSTAAGRPGKTIDDTLNERIGSQQQKSRSRSSGHSAQREKRHPSLAYHWIRAGSPLPSKPHHGHRRLLLRARRERPRDRRAAEQRYELTSLHVGRAALVIRLTGRGVRLIGSK